MLFIHDNVHATIPKHYTFYQTIQMALRVWKESMIEKVKGPLVKALLQEIKRYMNLFYSSSLSLFLSLSLPLSPSLSLSSPSLQFLCQFLCYSPLPIELEMSRPQT